MKALKEKIELEKGKDAFPVAGQKLIYAGNAIMTFYGDVCGWLEKQYVIINIL